MPALISLLVFVLASLAARRALDAGLLESLQKSARLLEERLRHAQAKAVAPKLGGLILACMLGTGLAGWLLFDSGWAGVLAAALGAGLPWAWASVLERRKLEKFSAQLASVIDLCSGALRSLEKRARLEELSQLVAALPQADKRGVPLAPALRTQSEQLRRLRTLRVKKLPAEAPLKILFP